MSPDPNLLLLDDRSTGTLATPGGQSWRLVTDAVMGGVSRGQLVPSVADGSPCLRLTGDVSLENNGGFIQMQLPLAGRDLLDGSAFSGLALALRGNGEVYALHLKTPDLDRPWQSYRAEITTDGNWQQVQVAFDQFQPHRTTRPLDVRKLHRFGIVGIGRRFSVDLCLGWLALYRHPRP